MALTLSAVALLSPHAEALDWATRATANGGQVSSTTLKAVSRFCKDIELFGLRDRFYRLNLLCGENLAAALVPVYVGQSFGGASYGYSIDQTGLVGWGVTTTPYTDANYTQRKGLQQPYIGSINNSAARQLFTNVSPSSLPSFDKHYSQSFMRGPGSAIEQFSLTSNVNDITDRHFMDNASSAFVLRAFLGGTGQVSVSTIAPKTPNNIIASRTSSSLMTAFLNGTSAGTTATVAPSSTNSGTFWTCGSFNGSSYWSYSIGLGMTSQQASDFNTALARFWQFIGRGV